MQTAQLDATRLSLLSPSSSSVSMTVTAVDPAGGYAAGVLLQPTPFLPPAAGSYAIEPHSPVDWPIQDLGGHPWMSSLTVPAPPAGSGDLESTSFEDGGLHGFASNLAEPEVVEPGQPVAEDGTHALKFGCPGTWGQTTLLPASKTLKLRLTNALVSTGADPTQSIEQIKQQLGWHLVVVGTGGRAEVSKDLTTMPMQLASGDPTSQVYVADPQDVELDIHDMQGSRVFIALYADEIHRSPESYYAVMYVDKIEF